MKTLQEANAERNQPFTDPFKPWHTITQGEIQQMNRKYNRRPRNFTPPHPRVPSPDFPFDPNEFM